MTVSRQLTDAFTAANEFLKPILKREEIRKARGDSIVEILSQNHPLRDPEDDILRLHVIQQALDLLTGVHQAFVNPVPDDGDAGSPSRSQKEDPALEDAKQRRTLHVLLDLISLEGIYPSLSQGVGIPLQQRVASVLPAGVIAKQPKTALRPRSQDESLLHHILNALNVILSDNRPGIQQVILGRILTDIICGAVELAFNSVHLSQDKRDTYSRLLEAIVNNTPTPTLLSTLSLLLRDSSAPWFKLRISAQLSHIPLRKDGVFQTTLFIASQFAPSLGQTVRDESLSGPPITVQAIMQISRLLSSIPQDISSDKYFYNIAPKLLSLLDGEDPDLKKTASYVIGSGILSKRAYGAPGTVGHTIFVKPIFDALNANITNIDALWLRRFSRDGSVSPAVSLNDFEGQILVDEARLLLSIERLASLASLHPNPGLLKRLVQPVLLPLWGLQCYAKEREKSWWHDKVATLLETYFSVSASVSRLETLVDHILWDGGSSWTFGPGQEGGISIRRRTDPRRRGFNIIQIIGKLDFRADDFLKLLAVDPQSEERAGDIFLYVTRQWLLHIPAKQIPEQVEVSRDQDESQSAMRKLTSAKLAEKLLDRFKDALSRHPMKVLEIVKQLIESEASRQAERAKIACGLMNASLRSLGNIVTNEASKSGKPGDSEDDSESTESLSAAFSLLSTVLASPDFSLTEPLYLALRSMKSQLDLLMPILPASLSQPATTASMLLEISLSPSLSSGGESETTDSRASDLQTHRRVLANLASPLPPIQAEGLSLLSRLITDSSPVLDIPSTLTLLLTLITNTGSESTSNDEFIYLNVIKVIGLLASKHPRTVVKTLVERYVDRNEEETLDQRLRIGEALLRTVQGLGVALTGDTAKILGENMISVAGRREMKPKAKKIRENKSHTERNWQRKDANDAPPSDLPIPMPQANSDTDSDADDPVLTAQSASILDAWAAGTTSDSNPDDLRARASAMSILASAIESSLAGLGPSIASASVEVALATLSIEPGPESAILRRAAVVLLLDLVKALNTARDSGLDLGFGFAFTSSSFFSLSSQDSFCQPSSIANISDIFRVLSYLETRETDTLVQGHVRTLVESMEAYIQKSLSIETQYRMGEEPKFELGDRLAGLDVQPLSTAHNYPLSVSRPRIEEIE